MKKSGNVAFRSSLGGYNKRDVYRYLETLNKEIIEKDEALEAEIEQLKKENSDLTEKNNGLSAVISQLETEKAVLESAAKEKDSLIEDFFSSSEKISAKLESLSDEYNTLCQKYAELSQAFDGIDDIKRKAQAYDRIVARAKNSKTTGQASTPHTSETVKNDNIKSDIDNILYNSAQQLLEYIKTTQERFNAAIQSAQSDTEALKARLNGVIDASKEKIMSQINNTQN